MNEFFTPIPSEMLSTAHTKPQVIVTIKGIKATCPQLNCDYVITPELVPSLNSFSISNAQMTIQLSYSSSLFSYTKDQVSVTYANTICLVSSLSQTSDTINTLVCDFPTNTDGTPTLEAGSYLPIIHIYGIGYVNVDTSQVSS